AEALDAVAEAADGDGELVEARALLVGEEELPAGGRRLGERRLAEDRLERAVDRLAEARLGRDLGLVQAIDVAQVELERTAQRALHLRHRPRCELECREGGHG